MKLPDTNVLLAAVNEDSAAHPIARSWLESAFSSPGGVGLAWLALMGFVRIATLPRVLPMPLAPGQAMTYVRDWFEAPRTRVLHPTPEHGPLLTRLLMNAGKAGNLVNDAHLAALAIEHGATLGSFDRDFERFEGLDFERLRA